MLSKYCLSLKYQPLHVASKVTTDFQERYFKVEYDTAVNSAYLAARWQEFDDDDILVFQTAGDSRVRDSHKKLDGVALPKSHNFWKTFYPPLSWNCRCTVVTTHSGRITPDSQIPYEEIDNVPSIFRSNFAVEGMAFPPKHPYYVDKIERIYSLSGKTVTKHIKGNLVESPLVKKYKGNDYNDVKICCKLFADNIGGTIEILPKLHIKDARYDAFFGGLKDTPYYGKCPDFKINDAFYELEGFLPDSSPKNRLKNMLNRGLKQSSRIVIMDDSSTDNHIKKVINLRVKKGKKIDEVWKWNADGLTRVY